MGIVVSETLENCPHQICVWWCGRESGIEGLRQAAITPVELLFPRHHNPAVITLEFFIQKAAGMTERQRQKQQADDGSSEFPMIGKLSRQHYRKLRGALV